MKRISSLQHAEPKDLPASAPTLKEIGARCGVDKSTVYRALSGRGRVKAGTVVRVRAAAAELGYDASANRAARRMASQRIGTRFINRAIALLLPSAFHRLAYYQRIHQGILNALAEAHYDLFTAQLEHEAPRVPHALAAGELDAAICVGAALPVAFQTVMRLAARPMVTVSGILPGASAVVADEESAAFFATSHLLGLGHRRLLHFFESTSPYPAAERIAGYRRACVERGLDPAQTLVGFDMPTDLPLPQWIARHLAEGLRRDPDITALLARNDEEARVLYDALVSMGKRVPDDLSLVGCDDVMAITDGRGQNLLTSVDLALTQIGEQAARLAIELIEGRAQPGGVITVPARLVVRGSTAAPRSSVRQL